MELPSATLPSAESAQVEWKTSLSDSRKIVETVAAMATIGGGEIWIGVRDSGEVVGAEPGAGEVERLVQQVLSGTDPRVFVDLEAVEVGGRPVLRIKVPPGDGPHLAFGRAFYRSGPSTVAMSRDEYERRLLERLRDSSGFDRRPLKGQSAEHLSASAAERFQRLAAPRHPAIGRASTPWDVLEHLHLTDGPNLTVAGLLIAGEDPQGPLPQAVVRARSQRGAQEDHASIEGVVFDQIDETVAFIARNLRTAAIREGVRREERAELPLGAVREVVANAVAHRDYRSTAPIQVTLNDEALTVWNPGALPAPLTVAALRESHPSIPPNPFLARALFLAGYIEEWGTGTVRVAEEMRAAGLSEPLFELTGENGIRVTLTLPGADPKGLPGRAVKALKFLGDPFRSEDYAQLAGVSHRTAVGDLRALEDRGMVKRIGVGRSTQWVRTGR